jgi:hypothetical protein
MVNRTQVSLWLRWLTRPALALAFACGLAGSSPSANAQVPPQTQTINELLAKTWEDNGLKPSAKANDFQFIRRIFIDLIGRVPSSDEVRDFERDTASNKRSKLIHRLLHDAKYVIPDNNTGKPAATLDYTSEYARHWANIWGVWLMTRGGVNEVYHEQMKVWLEEQFSKNLPYDQFVEKLLTASGKSNDNQAVNFIGAHLGDAVNPAMRSQDGPFDAVPITSRVTRLFLGIQVQCTQCHDHPFNPEWKQDNFWGVNTFFRQTVRDRAPSPADNMRKKKGEIAQFTVSDDTGLNSKAMIFFERRSGVLAPTKPVFLPDLVDLGADKPAKGPKVFDSSKGKSRRQVLADYVLHHDNFAKAYVNRIWAHLFGRGMNEQGFDDFGGHNKLLHPELLAKLADEFIKYRYDSKALIEWICNSDAYSLSHVANSTNNKPEHEPFFSRMLLKSMSPEVLFESLMEATKTEASKDERNDLREQFLAKLVRSFGDDEGNEVTFNGTIIQALMLMNGRDLNAAISHKSSGTVEKAIAKYKLGTGPAARVDERAMLDELYLSALARHPGSNSTIEYRKVLKVEPKTNKEVLGPMIKLSEQQFVAEQLAEMKKKPEYLRDHLTGYRQFYEDVFWALLNTNEFILNH